jgi:FAD/FMN-containing dehydrogenase
MISADFRATLGDIPVIDDLVGIKRKSRDYFWYSPILYQKLRDKTADLVVCPRNKADVLAIAAACARFSVPVTPRGGGTGNYGQAMPFEGGIVLDMLGLDRLLWVKDGVARVQSGKLLYELGQELRIQEKELRMFPSTQRIATIGGHIGGGAGGIGSINWGFLHDRGNVLAARIVTIEDEPRIIELRGRETDLINRSFGTTGIITELEVPVENFTPWRDVVVAFDDFISAVHFAQEFTASPGIAKNQCAVVDSTLTPYFTPLAKVIPEGKPVAILMVAPSGLASTAEIAATHGGQIVHEEETAEAEDNPAKTPVYEFCWNHTTLQVLKKDRGMTYIQAMFPAEHMYRDISALRNRFGDEVLWHLEFIRAGAGVACTGASVIRYTTAERLYEIMSLHEKQGVTIINPHVSTLDDGARDVESLKDRAAFKQSVDPYGLLNPGKMGKHQPARLREAK